MDRPYKHIMHLYLQNNDRHESLTVCGLEVEVFLTLLGPPFVQICMHTTGIRCRHGVHRIVMWMESTMSLWIFVSLLFR